MVSSFIQLVDMDLYLCNCQSYTLFRANPKALVDYTAEEICKFAFVSSRNSYAYKFGIVSKTNQSRGGIMREVERSASIISPSLPEPMRNRR
jgi:hypothetical protein